MRSSTATNAGAPGVVTSATNLTMACFTAPSFHEGSGCASTLHAKNARSMPAARDERMTARTVLCRRTTHTGRTATLRQMACVDYCPQGQFACSHPLVARQRGRQLALHVHVDVVTHVVDDLDDPPAGERELALVIRADRVAAVVADAQPFAAQRVVPGLRTEIAARRRLVVDVERHLAEALEILADRRLAELDAHDVLAGFRH